MIDRERPCDRGLTPGCFEEHPEWAKQAFAYRLLHTLFPPEITRRLPKIWRDPLIGPGANVPDEVDLPPGTVVPPDYDWDPVWTPWWLSLPWWLIWPEEDIPPDADPDYPPPPDVVIPPGTVFPPGWRIKDPLPPGVKLPPNPSGPGPTTPIRPVPPGVSRYPSISEATQKTGVLAHSIPAIWVPGPVHPVYSYSKEALFFSATAHTNDGRVGHVASSWEGARIAPSGTWVNRTEQYSDIGMYVYRWNSNFNIHRSFFWFYLGAIPGGSKVLSVTVTMGGQGFATNRVCIQIGSQGWTLFPLDYDSFKGVCFDHILWKRSDVGEPVLNEFTFNVTGRIYVETRLGKWIRFCVREYDHDYLDVTPDIGVRYQNGVFYSEYAETALKPTINIFYE